MANYKLNDYINFTFVTHDPETGAAVDADSTPTYRIYDTSSNTVVASGDCVAIDADNTIGYYGVNLQLLSPTFANDKSYIVYVIATVLSTQDEINIATFSVSEYDISSSTITAIANAVDIPTPEEIASEVDAPTVQEIVNGVSTVVPTAQEIVTAVTPIIPTAEEIAAAVDAPTVEEISEAIDIPTPPTVQEIVNGVVAAVPTTEEIADAIAIPDVPTVQEIVTGVSNAIIGGGDNTVTVTLVDENASPIPNLRVTLFNSDQTSILSKIDTNQLGKIVFGLANGTYKVVVSSILGYAPDNPYTLIVSGVTSSTLIVPTATSDTDGVVTLTSLVGKLRSYIDDSGSTVIRNVIGMADGTRKSFLLHHENIDTLTLSVTVNGTPTAVTISGNKITFSSAPALNAAIVAEYTFYEYSTTMLNDCILRAIGYLENAIDLGWGELDNSGSWEVEMSYTMEDIILTASILEFLQVQFVRLPVAISFGDIGARISLRGASTERQKIIKELRTTLIDKINKQLETDQEFDIITW